MAKKFHTTNRLKFYSKKWDNPVNDMGWMVYNIGTCNGQWRSTDHNYQILSFLNDEPGNGHLGDVFEWFEHYCRRDDKILIILNVLNGRFAKHLVEKRGFRPAVLNHYYKTF